MKKLLALSVITALIGGCSNPQSDKMEDFIPGMYVKAIEDEFTKGMDTLSIETLDEAARSFSIVRKTGYQQTIDGKQLSYQHKEENWTAFYDMHTHQLQVQKNGKLLTFLPDRGSVSLGSSEYQKIK